MLKDIVKGFCEKTKCMFNVYTTDYIDTNFYKKNDLGNIVTKNYSRGTSAPSGGKNGDIYDQYFN